MYRQGSQLRDELHRNQLRAAQLKDIACRFDKIEPVRSSFGSMRKQVATPNQFSTTGQFVSSEAATNARRSSPKLKAAATDSSVAGDSEPGEKPVDPVRVYSEKELTKEIEKAAGLLSPEQDWSVRIAAMQRIEAVIAGGASEYSCFMSSMKQLVGPLIAQLSDRRSSIVKQACHLLNFMSRELLSDFEIFAESFIPVLFKLVVITVLVIAESADTCIKTMLRNCRVSRVLPKLMECAKHDRNAVLRARCCEYALLLLEHWGDSPEIQRSVELYEDLIKCCVGDAMSEVRASARMCYRLFSKYWPERARRIFITFDASVQRILNDEDGGYQKRHASPLVRDRGLYAQQSRQSASTPGASISHQAVAPGPTTLGTGRSSSALSGLGPSAMNSTYQSKSVELGPERTLNSALQADQQEVNAVETISRGMEISEKGAGWAAGNSARVAELTDRGTLSTAARAVLGGSYGRIHALSVANRLGVDPPSARDPPQPASAPVWNQNVDPSAPFSIRGTTSVGSGVVDGIGNNHHHAMSDTQKGPYSHGWDAEGVHINLTGRDRTGSFAVGIPVKRVALDRHGPDSPNGEVGEVKGPKRVLKPDVTEKGYIEKGAMDFCGIPGFQRPLLRQSASQRSSGSSRSGLEENPVLVQFNALGESQNYMDGLMSLNDALTEGLSATADWSARVAAFTFLRNLLQQGSKCLQDINQSFGLVMKLFSAHLDDPHHKVASAALATLAELVPACRKSFEAYLERILPQVFARLVDSKEAIRQLGTNALEIVGNTYNIDSLLPALLRSLDEQRSPKAKVAVIEFAIVAFAKLALNGEATGGSGLLKLWLAKLGPLANDKNPKLRETAVTGIISVYSHFDSTTVLNFILSLSIDEQNLLRRSLKQYTPRIEVDLMAYLQSKSQRPRSKTFYDHSDTASATSAENYVGPSRNAHSTALVNQPSLDYSTTLLNVDCGGKPENSQRDTILTGNQLLDQSAGSWCNLGTQTVKSSGRACEIFEQVSSGTGSGRTQELTNGYDESNRSTLRVNGARNYRGTTDIRHDSGNCSLVDAQGLVHYESRKVSVGASPETRQMFALQSDDEPKYHDKGVQKPSLEGPSEDPDSPISTLLHQMVNWVGKQSKEKQESLQQLLTMSSLNVSAVWSVYFLQILTVIFESLDDTDAKVKELAMSVVFELLSNQRDSLVDSTEVLLEKLIQSSKDPDLKVCSAADRCLTVVLTEFDPHRCLLVVVPLLDSEDEKSLIVCIGSLTKLVSRLPSVELMAQLPTFLPVLFEAFGNKNADVRKTVVFCLVEIYIVLGKAFVPYLGSLSSTQLRLVTIYANRISQARTGTYLESLQLQ